MEHIASISYGKDSLAMLEVIKQHGLPLDRIIHMEIWATKGIPADLPEMMAFKKKADEIIKAKYGIEVEHITSPHTYEDFFYYVSHGKKSKYAGKIYGFPMQKGNWCNGRLKADILHRIERNAITYIGIASDEPRRFHNLSETKRSPLVEFGWTEEMCREWCRQNDLLSPIYTTATRGGCWFCHNQGVDQLRILRKQHPELWEMLMKWDLDSPISFKANGITIHDFDKRFSMEEKGELPNAPFRWKFIKQEK